MGSLRIGGDLLIEEVSASQLNDMYCVRYRCLVLLGSAFWPWIA